MSNSISNSITVAAADLDKAIAACFSINARINNNRGKMQAALVDFIEAYNGDAGKLAVAFAELPTMVKYAAMTVPKLAADATDEEKAAHAEQAESKKQLDNILRGQLRGLDAKLDGVVLRLSKGSIAVLPAPKPVIEVTPTDGGTADAVGIPDANGTTDEVQLPAVDALLAEGSPVTAQGTNDAPDADDVATAPDTQDADTIPPFEGEPDGVRWLAALPFNHLQQVCSAASEQRLAAGAIGRIRAVQ